MVNAVALKNKLTLLLVFKTCLLVSMMACGVLSTSVCVCVRARQSFVAADRDVRRAHLEQSEVGSYVEVDVTNDHASRQLFCQSVCPRDGRSKKQLNKETCMQHLFVKP